MTSNGEEATAIGSAAALTLDDVVRCAKPKLTGVGGGTRVAPGCVSASALARQVMCRRCANDCMTFLQVFTQYREHGVLVWRGFGMDEFANQVRF